MKYGGSQGLKFDAQAKMRNSANSWGFSSSGVQRRVLIKEKALTEYEGLAHDHWMALAQRIAPPLNEVPAGGLGGTTVEVAPSIEPGGGPIVAGDSVVGAPPGGQHGAGVGLHVFL
jgi:hypothetical protein